MDDDQVNLEEIADSKRRREAARLAESDKAAAPTANELQQGQGNEAAPKQWVKHVTKWLGAKSTLMQTRRVLALKKKPATRLRASGARFIITFAAEPGLAPFPPINA